MWVFLCLSLLYSDGVMIATPPDRTRPARCTAGTVWRICMALCLMLGAVAGGFSAADAKPHKKAAHAKQHAAKHHVRAKPARRTKRKSEPVVQLAARSPVASEAQSVPAKPAFAVLTREEILNSDAAQLARVGRHVVVGYHDFEAIRALVLKQAIGGIFITDHNVRGRKTADVKANIDELQAIRKSQGLPPLIIAADQEGGQVSRLSPPLKKQPSLARILVGLGTDEARRVAVEAYAQTQADELKHIGVTLNFAPVVDLKLDPSYRDDGETRLRMRAIAADPYLVWKVAGWYCDVFAKSGLMCTLKHFPGLGRVKRDTHVVSGEVAASEGQLELNDWVPFRRLMDRPNVATMLGHVRVAAIDKSTPASFSHKIIHGLIRDTWHHDGLLITDDLSMGAVTHNKAGVGGAAVKSIDAGADLVLVSFSEKYLDEVLSALLAADAKGEIDATMRDKSGTRLTRVLGRSTQQ